MSNSDERWTPGFFVRLPGYFDNNSNESDGEADDENKDSSVSYSKKDQTAINLLPSFPEGLGWNEAREKWTTWSSMFLRLLELTPSLKSERAKETVLIAKESSMVEDIAFPHRPAPTEITKSDANDKRPVFQNLKRINSNMAIDVEQIIAAPQESNEPFIAYVSKLLRLANLCGFGENKARSIENFLCSRESC